MKKIFIALMTIVVLSLGWGVIRFTVMLEGYGLEPIAPQDDSSEFGNQLQQRLDAQYKGNFVAAVIESGQVVFQHAGSVGQPVDADTVFGVASVSKWVTALGVMVLVEQGRVSLDEPVQNYLTRWSLPPSEYDNRKVTLRRLLSHTAGIEDGLGHNGFAPGEPVQPLEAHLTQALDADEGVSGKVVVTQEPGSVWQYSGGSYNLIQLIIEEVSGQSFSDYMQQHVFQPLSLKATGFSVDRQSPDTAEYFATDQTLRVYPNYTSLAATGLYTTVNDMHRLVLAGSDSTVRPAGFPELLSDESLQVMRQPHGSVQGLDIWGLGTMLFAESEHGHIIGHGGKSPNLNATVRFEPLEGSAFIMFQTGNEEAFASDMATEWTVWKTSKPDLYIVMNQTGAVIKDIILGTALILVAVMTGLMLSFRRARLQQRPAP